MPKKPEVKKPVAKSPAKPQPAPVKSLEPSRAIVYQLFECLTKLDVASQLVSQVGIFPGPESTAEALIRQSLETRQSLDRLVKAYREEWLRMKGETGA